MMIWFYAQYTIASNNFLIEILGEMYTTTNSANIFANVETWSIITNVNTWYKCLCSWHEMELGARFQILTRSTLKQTHFCILMLIKHIYFVLKHYLTKVGGAIYVSPYQVFPFTSDEQIYLCPFKNKIEIKEWSS